MKTTIAIRNAEFFAHHGYYAEEQKMGNYFVIDLEVEVKTFDTLDDDINDTVNYEDLYQICVAQMNNTKKLLETVVLCIVKDIQVQWPDISGRISLSKKSPQIGGKVGSAVITMTF